MMFDKPLRRLRRRAALRRRRQRQQLWRCRARYNARWDSWYLPNWGVQVRQARHERQMKLQQAELQASRDEADLFGQERMAVPAAVASAGGAGRRAEARTLQESVQLLMRSVAMNVTMNVAASGRCYDMRRTADGWRVVFSLRSGAGVDSTARIWTVMPQRWEPGRLRILVRDAGGATAIPSGDTGWAQSLDGMDGRASWPSFDDAGHWNRQRKDSDDLRPW